MIDLNAEIFGIKMLWILIGIAIIGVWFFLGSRKSKVVTTTGKTTLQGLQDWMQAIFVLVIAGLVFIQIVAMFLGKQVPNLGATWMMLLVALGMFLAFRFVWQVTWEELKLEDLALIILAMIVIVALAIYVPKIVPMEFSLARLQLASVFNIPLP